MATLGLIGTGLAWLNMRKAQKEHDALVEKQDALVAAMQILHESKRKTEKEEPDWVDPNPIDLMDGISCTTILRVGNLIGNVFHAKASVVITNNSDREYYIHSVAADCFVLGCPVVPYRLRDWWKIGKSYSEMQKQSVAVDKVLAPGDIWEIDLPGGTSAIYTSNGVDKLPELRAMIASAAGKKLFTSVTAGKFNIIDGETADIRIEWWGDFLHEANTTGRWKNHVTQRKPGVLRYCGEAFYAN